MPSAVRAARRRLLKVKNACATASAMKPATIAQSGHVRSPASHQSSTK